MENGKEDGDISKKKMDQTIVMFPRNACVICEGAVYIDRPTHYGSCDKVAADLVLEASWI